MFPFATRVRIAIASVILALVAVLAAALWHFGTTPTDENLFRQPPSPVLLTGDLDGIAIKDEQRHPISVGAGDLVLLVGDEKIGTIDDYVSTLAGRSGPVRLRLLHGGPRQVEDVEVDAATLRGGPIRDVSRMAHVIDVTPGGASARAGMEVGDLIYRINGQAFDTILQADQILRSGTVGHSTNYDVLRNGQPLTLHVTLAAFGVRIGLLSFSIAGLCFMAFGGFVALLRPQVPAARYQGLAFILFGLPIGVMFLRRADDSGIVALRDIVAAFTFFLAFALTLHASMYFPRTRPSLLRRRWVLPVGYALAIGSALLALRFPDRPALTALAALFNLLYTAGIRWMGRCDLTPDTRRILRWLNITGGIVTGVVVFTVANAFRKGLGINGVPGYIGLLLILIPLAQLWAISRYRLLDLHFRLRRHVQYSLVSAIWALVPFLLLLWLVLTLPRMTLPVPNVHIQGSSIEVMPTPVPTAERLVLEKTALMMVAIVVAFALRRIGQRGQRWIAGKFYRTEHDYRRAAKEVSKLVTARPDLDGLAMGLADAVVKLLKVKRAGTMFLYQHRLYGTHRGRGFTDEQWQGVEENAEAVLGGVEASPGEVAAEFAPPKLRAVLKRVEVPFLYPLRSHDELVGTLLIGEKLAEDVFRSADFEFLGALTSQVAPAIENAFLYNELAQQERMKHELEIARRIQLESLPQFTPQVEGLDISGVSIPAFEVGGDYFDYLDGDARHLTVMVGDVSGKGTSAALYMSKLQGIVRSLHAFDLSPREFFVRTNDLLGKDLEQRAFVTAIGGFFETAERRMVLARAGHLPLYFFSAGSGTAQRILPPGLGFGLSSRNIFELHLREEVISYSPGDVFLFITDGITDSLAPSGDDFGEDRVLALLQRVSGGCAREIRDEVTAAVQAFSGSTEQFDDQTVVVIKATG